jgi:hypothetical protein
MGWLGEGDRAMAAAEASRRRVVVVIVGALVVVAGVAVAARHALSARARGAAAVPALGWEEPAGRAEERSAPQGGFVDGAPLPVPSLRGETLVPRGEVAVGRERVAPFQGFGVAVDSSPPGARVFAAGAEVGETPITASVRCTPGDRVEVRVQKTGFRPWRRTTICRSDALVALEARLAR